MLVINMLLIKMKIGTHELRIDMVHIEKIE